MPILVDPPKTRRTPKPSPGTKGKPQRNLWRFRFPWVKTAVSAPTDDDELRIENLTSRTWALYLGYRSLGRIEPETQRVFHVVKSGLLQVRPVDPPLGSEFLTADIRPATWVVQICRGLEEEEEVYELRVLGMEQALGGKPGGVKGPLLRRVRGRFAGLT